VKAEEKPRRNKWRNRRGERRKNEKGIQKYMRE
jgi:hypothetical protein